MANAHHGNNTSRNGDHQAGSSTGFTKIAEDEVEDDHEEEDIVLHKFRLRNLSAPRKALPSIYETEYDRVRPCRSTQTIHSDAIIDQCSAIEGGADCKA